MCNQWAPKVARKCESKHWYALGADGRSVYSHVITKFSRMGSLPYFLTHGAPLLLSLVFWPQSLVQRSHATTFVAKNMNETSVVFPATKNDRGNQTFLPLQHLAFSAPMLHSSRLLNLRKGFYVRVALCKRLHSLNFERIKLRHPVVNETP